MNNCCLIDIGQNLNISALVMIWGPEKEKQVRTSGTNYVIISLNSVNFIYSEFFKVSSSQ